MYQQVVAEESGKLSKMKRTIFISFTALLGAPHPSAHLMSACGPQPSALFKDAFLVASQLNLRPSSTLDELLTSVAESVRRRHEGFSRAISTLQLPGCVSS